MNYTKEGSEILEKKPGEQLDDVPMTLSGDFQYYYCS